MNRYPPIGSIVQLIDERADSRRWQERINTIVQETPTKIFVVTDNRDGVDVNNHGWGFSPARFKVISDGTTRMEINEQDLSDLLDD